MLKKLFPLVCLLPLSCVAASGDDLAIESYCSTGQYAVVHRVEIGQVQGIGQHRNGFLQISVPSESKALKKALLDAAQPLGISAQCIEYLDGKQLLVMTGDKSLQSSLLGRVYFDFDNAQLTPFSKQILDYVARQLAKSEQVVALQGNTDNRGSQKYNYQLGIKRAEQSADYLHGKGIRSQRLLVESKGEQAPIETNDSEFGRENNRRVDIILP
ncbi:hypothetical protein ABT56_16335 [Photobacterium aquae]|uniref:OmpA-like domain-containing protein n=1 Tax=Photobacterium aquae TaxID=1195763 RepID=A0A0J1GXL2_9GAMM|nr:OmpA family protein [Photobacterium aquae]KLV04174.1 hypothetical protein ABT56_16335 [Photobacterium aquae]